MTQPLIIRRGSKGIMAQRFQILRVRMVQLVEVQLMALLFQL